MLRLCVPACASLLALSCKGQKNKAPDLDHAPDKEKPAEAPDPDTEKPGSTALLDLHGSELPQGASGRLGSLRMMDRSIRHMIFNADGTKLISTHTEGYQIWNLDDASRGRLMKLSGALPGNLMSVSPNGKLLATSVDESDKILLWDIESGKATGELKSKGKPMGLCFQGNKRLVSASEDGGVTTWKLKSSGDATSTTYQGDWTEPTAFGCSQKSQWVGIGTLEGQAYVMEAGSESAILLGSATKRMHAVAISSDGKTFAFGSADERIHIWHKPVASKALQVEAHEGSVINLAFSPDDSKLHSSGGDWWFQIWNPKDGELLDELPGIAGLEAQLMALSPDGNLKASWSQHAGERGSEAGRWWFWNALSGALLLEPARHRYPLTSIHYSPDGRTIATSSEDFSVRVWDSKSTQSLALLEGAEGPIGDLRYSKDGSTIFSAGKDAVLRAWSWEANKDSKLVDAIGGPVNRLIISADGKTAYTGDQIGRVWSWDLKTGNQIQALDRQGYSAIYALDISADGKFLAIAGSARIIRIIDLNGGQEVAQLNPGDTAANYTLRFSPDGKRLATAGDGHEIQIWNTSDWTRNTTYAGHDGTVRCLDYSPDGTRLVSGGNDEMVKVWDTKSGKEVAALHGHADVVSAIAVAPDGKSFASASRDRTALIWDMP